MNKPITIKREEFKECMTGIINDSGLPAFIIEPILQELLIEVKNAARMQYQHDLKQYEEYLKSIGNECCQEEQ